MPGRYLGYFVNKFGEQLVFVHYDGDAHATLFHGEVDWEPYRVTDAGGRPEAGDLILNHEECAFVIACWTRQRGDAKTLSLAGQWRRPQATAPRPRSGRDPSPSPERP
ncbi:MAG: hypothetical protein ACLP01_05640 [Solirubrobacteraceae bacterium]